MIWFFKRTQIFSMTPRQVQEAVEKGGDAASYIAGNSTALVNGVIDSAKGVVMTNSGSRIGDSVFKGAKDYARDDVMCTGLCATSGVCETAVAIIV